VGGCPSAYTLAFVRAVPELRATLLDLPAFVGIAGFARSWPGTL
jgi:hypothetical protein